MAAQYILTRYNTVPLTAGTGLRLVAQVPGCYYLNLLNLGPGTLYYSVGSDPAVGDPASVTLPVNLADNQIVWDGAQGVGVISDQTGKISIRSGAI